MEFTSHKAIVATIFSFLVIFGGIWVNDSGDFTGKEIVNGLITAAIGSGLTGGATYKVQNKIK